MASTNKMTNAYVISVIGEGSVFRGDLNLQGVLHINGDFYGDIKTVGDIAVGVTGRAQCNIEARNVIISGAVEGSIRASSSVHLNSSAVVIGDIESSLIVVEAEAILHGNARTKSPETEQMRALQHQEEAVSVWQK